MLKPLRGKLLIEVLDDTKRTESGLYIADNIETIPHRGKVVELGLPYRDKKQREYPWGIQPGHIVHFTRQWDKQKITHYIIRRDQVFAIEHEDKAYAIGEYVIIRKVNEVGDGKIYVPKHFESEVAKQVEYGIVMSVGRDNRMGINVGDKLVYYKNEGLKVAIPLQEELWSLKSRAIIGIIN